jgi:hypothetical protein
MSLMKSSTISFALAALALFTMFGEYFRFHDTDAVLGQFCAAMAWIVCGVAEMSLARMTTERDYWRKLKS